MHQLPHAGWLLRLEEQLRRPLIERAASIMAAFSVVQLAASIPSTWLVERSGQVHMGLFGTIVVAGAVELVLAALVLRWLAPRDPEGLTRTSRAVMTTIAIGYGSFGVAIAYGFGFWASPFLLFPAVNALLVGIVFSRHYGVISVVASVAGTSVLELLRVDGHVPYAPALIDDSVQGSGTLERVIGTGGPLLVFVVLTVSLAFGMLRVVDDQRRALARTHEMIRRYVPEQVVDAVLVHGDTSTRLQRRKLTVFFSDVVGFTETTERMEPEELEVVVGEYFSEMARIASTHDGTIDELVGDAVLIFFGAPVATTDRDHALRAVRMAVEMQEAVELLNQRWERAGIDARFRIRMGINTGVVAVGNVGSGARQKYAALGRAVNLAARIQTHSAPGQVLLSRATWLLVRDEVPCELVDTVELKGIGHPVELYTVADAAAGHRDGALGE